MKKDNYFIVVIPCEEGGYYAEIPDLPGCMTQAETFEELENMILDAKKLWIETAKKNNIFIPYPTDYIEIKETKKRVVIYLRKHNEKKISELKEYCKKREWILQDVIIDSLESMDKTSKESNKFIDLWKLGIKRCCWMVCTI